MSWLARALRIGVPAAALAAGSPTPLAAQNPCPDMTAATALQGRAAAPPFGVDKRFGTVDNGGRWGVLDSVWNHRSALEQGLLRPVAADDSEETQVEAEDIGEIAVLRDAGDLVRAANIYDLRDVKLRFSPNDDGGYDVSHLGTATWRSPVGEQLTLGDDDSTSLELPFEFSYYANTHEDAFVNSDGNITFEEADSASTSRNVSRLLSGAPRIAPFLADLDPSRGGGVFAQTGEDAVTVTWCAVPEYGSQLTTTVQAALLSTGVVEMTFDAGIGTGTALVGLSPGRTTSFESVDLSDTAGATGGSAAVGERFGLRGELDTVAVAQKFMQSHPDAYDQVIIWTDAPILIDAFAYHVTIANDIQGIGLPTYDIPSDFGSDELSGIAVMGWLGKYSDDTEMKLFEGGEDTTLSILGHEVGHRWLAFPDFSNHDRVRSSALLGRDHAHWSFFFDSDASVMEGNDIEDLGGGAFRTVAAVEGYSPLDQYVMGLRDASDVPSFFYVEAPTNTSPPARRAGSPRVGVTFNGTRRDVLIEDIIEVEGERVPSAADSPRVQRQAFLYVVRGGRDPNPDHVAKLDRIRQQWETYFHAATDNRMTAETRLRPPAATETTDP
ncbi:MAG: hypothetical protein OXH69_20570 [Acidobacteria bacterium]|nr:hypothetical protein [Acidobacteriota bacterium]